MQTEYDREMKDITKSFNQEIKLIREQLIGRPSWAVTLIITFLSTIALSSLTFVFTVAKMAVENTK